MRLRADCDDYTLDILCDDDTNLDDRFRAICLDTGDILYINGWLWSFEPLGLADAFEPLTNEGAH